MASKFLNCFGTFTFMALIASPLIADTGDGSDFDAWLKLEANRSFIYLSRNVSAPGTAPGAVLASPSQENPNYYYHWVRDAALTINPFIDLYIRTQDVDQKARLSAMLKNYIQFSYLLQHTKNLSGGLGEPKFMVDGQPFMGDWGRPQNDSPALRAMSLVPLAWALIHEGQSEYVKNVLYDTDQPAHTVIKNDLEYVAQHWTEPCFDLWEEVRGQHFYTLLVERQALIDGAELAAQFQDIDEAKRFLIAALGISRALEEHWNIGDLRLSTAIKVTYGPLKKDGLDSSILLGVIEVEQPRDALRATGIKKDSGILKELLTDQQIAILNTFSLTDDRIMLSALKLRAEFQSEYAINSRDDMPAFVTGRYPNDTYNGYETGKLGNPWFLTTLGYAEYLFRLRTELARKNEISISDTNISFYQMIAPTLDFDSGTRISNTDPRFAQILDALRLGGDQLLKRISLHLDHDTGQMAEQINREKGFAQGARDLSWSYAAFLTAVRAR